MDRVPLAKERKNFDPCRILRGREMPATTIATTSLFQRLSRKVSKKKGHASVPKISVDLLDQPNFPLWLAAIKSRGGKMALDRARTEF